MSTTCAQPPRCCSRQGHKRNQPLIRPAWKGFSQRRQSQIRTQFGLVCQGPIARCQHKYCITVKWRVNGPDGACQPGAEAIIATRWHSAGVRSAATATTPTVVLAPTARPVSFEAASGWLAPACFGSCARIGAAKLRHALIVKRKVLGPECALGVAHGTDGIDRQQCADTYIIVKHGADHVTGKLMNGFWTLPHPSAVRLVRRNRLQCCPMQILPRARQKPLCPAGDRVVCRPSLWHRHCRYQKEWPQAQSGETTGGEPILKPRKKNSGTAPCRPSSAVCCGSRIKTVNRTSRQTNSIHTLNQIGGLQSFCFARAGPAAQYCTTRNARCIWHHNADAM